MVLEVDSVELKKDRRGVDRTTMVLAGEELDRAGGVASKAPLE